MRAVKTMSAKNIVIGQKMAAEKIQRAKELRRQMTEAEQILWQCLRANRLNGWHFRHQQVIAGFIVDFYCHAASLVVELDGPVHENQAEYDLERERALQGLALRVLRIKNQEVLENPDFVLQKIGQACAEGSFAKF